MYKPRFLRAKLGLLMALLLLALQPVEVAAQTVMPLTAEEISLIPQHCSSAQINLEELLKRDAVSRINRGRDYDETITQVTAMNSRIAYNKVNVPDLLTIASEMQLHIDRFRSVSDKEYLEHLDAAIKFDCKGKPADFYSLIQQLRDDRNRVVAEITKLDELIGQYRQALVAYQQTLPQKEQPNAN
jgi:hypothetical protein